MNEQQTQRNAARPLALLTVSMNVFSSINRTHLNYSLFEHSLVLCGTLQKVVKMMIKIKVHLAYDSGISAFSSLKVLSFHNPFNLGGKA